MSRPLTIAYLIDDLGPRGSQRQLVELATRLNRERFSPHVFYYVESDFQLQRLREADIPVHFLEKKQGFTPRFSITVARHAQAIKADIIHAYLVAPNFYGSAAARMLPKCRSIASERSNFPNRPMRVSMLEAVGFHASHAVTANSRTAGGRLQREYHLRPGKIFVIPNGIDVDRFRKNSEKRRSFRRQFGFGEKDFVVLLSGSISPEKNSLLFLEAFANAKTGFTKSWKILLLGSQPNLPYAEKIDSLIASRKLADSVSIIDAIANVEDAYCGCDALALPSLFEGCPNAVLEAMATERPILASRISDLPSIIGHKEAGWLFDPEDVDSMVSAMIEMDAAEEPDLRSMGVLARKRIVAGFSMQQLIRRHETLYESLAGNIKREP